MTQDLKRRYDWFRQAGAGGIVGENARTCLALARAEQWLREQDDIEPISVPDDDPDLSWMDEDEQKQEHTIEVYALVRRCPDYGLDYRHAEWLASIWNVVDADAAYARILWAELAAQVQGGR